MTHRPTRRTLLALALLALPAGLHAQQAEHAAHTNHVQHAASGAYPVEQVQQWIDELQQINRRLTELQQQALQDPDLSAAEQALGAGIKAAMDAADPQLERSSARMAELESEARAAQEAGDDGKLQELGAEAQRIQTQFRAAQEKALQQPALAAEVEAFQARLQARMVELDPAAEQAIARFRELEGKVAEAMRAG